MTERRIHTGCPVVRTETVRFRDASAPGTEDFERRILWIRRASVSSRMDLEDGSSVPGSRYVDRRHLFESLDMAVASARDAIRASGPMMASTHIGRCGFTVSVSVEDFPVLAEDGSARAWTSMDALMPGYTLIPDDWVVPVGAKRRRKGEPTARRLDPVEVRALAPAWSSGADDAWNEAARTSLSVLVPVRKTENAPEASEAAADVAARSMVSA